MVILAGLHSVLNSLHLLRSQLQCSRALISSSDSVSMMSCVMIFIAAAAAAAVGDIVW